jgi:hypothetical protein
MPSLFFADRVLESTTSVGLAPIKLDGAVAGFRSFVDAAPGDQAFAYVISGDGTAPQWEVGTGTLVAANGGFVLNRNAEQSSDGAGPCDFVAGQKSVALTASARWYTQVQEPPPPPPEPEAFTPDIQTPIFQNGWNNFAPWAASVRYYRSAEGRTYLSGNMSGGAGGNNVVLFTLPSDMRPLSSEYFAVRNGGTSEVLGIYIRNNGDVVLQSGSPSWFSLSGINFLAHP